MDVESSSFRVISHIPSFAQPILDLIAEYSGWKVTLIAGGPEPADAGRLNMCRQVIPADAPLNIFLTNCLAQRSLRYHMWAS